MRVPLVPPPIVMLAAGAAQVVLAGRRRPSRTSLAAGGALAAGAGLVHVAAVRTMRRADTTLTPLDPASATALVESGVFARSRNPIYLAMAAQLAAHALVRRSAVALLPVAAFVAIIDRRQIPAEEAALRRLFGTDYDAYCSRVHRWL